MNDGRHGLITGQTRSGKTTLAKRLTDPLPRVLFLDRVEDYDNGNVFYDFNSAIDFYMQNRAGDFRIIFRGEGDVDKDARAFTAWLELLQEAQKTEKLDPVLIVMEEASLYSTVHDLDPVLKRLYLYGARWGISLLSIVQRDVLIHPIVRDSTHWFAALRNMKVSGDFARMFDVSQMQQLETLTPGVEPVEGTHVLYYPQGTDPAEELSRSLTAGG